LTTGIFDITCGGLKVEVWRLGHV